MRVTANLVVETPCNPVSKGRGAPPGRVERCHEHYAFALFLLRRRAMEGRGAMKNEQVSGLGDNALVPGQRENLTERVEQVEKRLHGAAQTWWNHVGSAAVGIDEGQERAVMTRIEMPTKPLVFASIVLNPNRALQISNGFKAPTGGLLRGLPQAGFDQVEQVGQVLAHLLTVDHAEGQVKAGFPAYGAEEVMPGLSPSQCAASWPDKNRANIRYPPSIAALFWESWVTGQ